MGSIKIKVEGMACGGCEKSVEAALGKLKGVTSVAADHAAKNVDIVYEGDDFNLDEAHEAVKKAGYTVPV